MRTTVNLDDELLVRAKELAARTRRPLGSILEDALRLLLTERAGERAGVVRLPTFGGNGLRPGVDLEDKESLAALLDDDEGGPRAAG